MNEEDIHLTDKEFFQLLEDKIKEEGPENVLRDIKKQNIKGPSAAEMFGEDFAKNFQSLIESETKKG